MGGLWGGSERWEGCGEGVRDGRVVGRDICRMGNNYVCVYISAGYNYYGNERLYSGIDGRSLKLIYSWVWSTISDYVTWCLTNSKFEQQDLLMS